MKHVIQNVKCEKNTIEKWTMKWTISKNRKVNNETNKHNLWAPTTKQKAKLAIGNDTKP